MDTQLLDILVCPICKGPLQHDKKALELICNADRLAFPIRDGIPIMWADQARELHNAADIGVTERDPSLPAA
ncbi:Trm112 family protein [Glaciimonas sp. PAMC28666]|uniref:Trm112 family protein n=1 Tax=Glaciimonas sp. PAMC28666 TaxID=2807626 RepID=UPI001964DB14|nr:Trm112 family protein [Glaciimonas sp. PAMC28666]QRX81523.1 Trm112 family protein [Glaciimonas sp. PAMC28666]